MNDLPKSWVECQLEDILLALESGSRPKGGVRNIREGIPSIGGEHLNYNGGFDFSKLRYVPELFAMKMSKGQIRKKDILIVKDGATTGKTSFVNDNFPYENAVVNEHVFICRTSSLLEPKFVFRFLTSKVGQSNILSNFQGSAQGGINTKFISNTIIPLAPLNEQKRIVEKLDKLIARVEEAKERLEKIPVIIKRFRQSVLNAAVTGELTKDWRERNGIGDNTWIEKNISEVILDLRYGTAKALVREKIGYPTIRIPNIGEFYLNADDLKYTNLSKNELEKLKLQVGDILLIRSNGSVSLVGKSAIVRESEQEFVFAGYLIRLRVDQKKINPEYLNYVLHSTSVREQIEIPARSTSGVNNINSEEVKSLKFLLPIDLDEQKEIVKRVETLFKKADEIEERYKKAKAYVDKLTQSILAKAFRGELVPQDPNDEPAGKLLERIKAEKEKITDSVRSKRKSYA